MFERYPLSLGCHVFPIHIKISIGNSHRDTQRTKGTKKAPIHFPLTFGHMSHNKSAGQNIASSCRSITSSGQSIDWSGQIFRSDYQVFVRVRILSPRVQIVKSSGQDVRFSGQILESDYRVSGSDSQVRLSRLWVRFSSWIPKSDY